MQCAKCGSENAEGGQFCTKCGAPLGTPAASAHAYAPPPAAPAAYAPPPPGQPSPYAPPPGAPAPGYAPPGPPAAPPKKKRGCVIALVILGALLLCCIGSAAAAYFGLLSLGKPRDLGVRYGEPEYRSAITKLGVDVSEAGPSSPTATGGESGAATGTAGGAT
ncbi:MAG TPA: zinc-ribbon domain-containing protein, partial [Coriobacteriia bacterium]